MDRSEKHFVLVHGAGHGAWCWYKVATLLRSAGQRVTAFDLAASGINPKLVNELRSISDYVKPLMEFMESLPDDDRVVLVGHSAGGFNISVAMERFPKKISVAIFATAYMYGPDTSYHTVFQKLYQGILESSMDSQLMFDNGLDKPPTSVLWGPKYMLSDMYEQSPREDWTLATKLVRPYPLFLDEPEQEQEKETKLTKENYGSVRRVYIVSEADKAIKESLQRWMIENNPPEEVRVISGADHMLMLSRPQELCSYLQELSKTQ